MDQTKHRLQFDLTPEALEQFDDLREASGAQSRAELIRKALQLYAWFLLKKNDGWRLQVRKGSRVKDVEVLL